MISKLAIEYFINNRTLVNILRIENFNNLDLAYQNGSTVNLVKNRK